MMFPLKTFDLNILRDFKMYYNTTGTEEGRSLRHACVDFLFFQIQLKSGKAYYFVLSVE